MNTFQSIFLIVFGVVAYMMIVDKNVGEYLTLIFKIIKIKTERFIWMIRFNPRNPIINLIKKWEYEKLAKELEKEFGES